MTARIPLPDLLEAFEWASAVGPFENVAYVSRASGQIWLVSDLDDSGVEPPEDADDDKLYLMVPSRTELDLGRSLALEFTAQQLADCSAEVRGLFAKPGAYAKFKDLLEKRGALEAWYAFEASGTKQALCNWASQNDIELVDPA